jgi:hypothetical protein
MTYEGVEYYVARYGIVEASNLLNFSNVIIYYMHGAIPTMVNIDEENAVLLSDLYTHSGCAFSITQALQVIKLMNIGRIMSNG